jgi:hypothetical protein
MKHRAHLGPVAGLLTSLLVLACQWDPGGAAGNGEGGEGGDPGETGGSGGAGGSGGGMGGSGGARRMDAAAPAGGSGGAGGAGGSAAPVDAGGGATPDAEAPAPDSAPAGDGGGGPVIGPSAPGQGGTAQGMIVYSQDFEGGNHDGITRSPTNLPADRVTIVDDPLGQRGKVLKVVYQAGDNFRTSGGTEPRSWVSNRQGNEFRPGEKMSHAFGIMVQSAAMNYAFGQVISSGGPVWMLIGGPDGTLTVFCNTCGGNTRHMKLEANKWYDFRVDIDFSVGGPVNFYVNGQMFRMGRVESTRGTIAHWDGGIYNRAGQRAERTVYISNLSVGKR